MSNFFFVEMCKLFVCCLLVAQSSRCFLDFSIKFKCKVLFSVFLFLFLIFTHHFSPSTDRRSTLHVLELIDATLRVAFSDLAQCLVFVAPLAYVLPMDLVVGGFFRVVARMSQILFQCLKGSLFKKLSHVKHSSFLPSTGRVIARCAQPKCVYPRRDLWCVHLCPSRVTHRHRLIRYRR